MDRFARLVAKLDVDRKGFDRGLKGGTSRLKSFVSGAMKIAAPLAAVFGARASVDNARIQVQAEKKLQAVLKATGHAAGLTADEVKRYAGELQNLTNFGDEGTIGAAGVLATFKEIRGEVFKDSLRLAQDMASVMDGDLKGSIVQIGKALNDPVKGISALSKVGVSFTQQQREHIAQLQKSGDMVGAQRVILRELESEFGGAAAAMADPITQMTNTVGDLSEKFGYLIAIPFGGLAEEVTSLMNELAPTDEAVKELGAQLRDDIVPAFRELVGWTRAIMDVFSRDPEQGRFAPPQNLSEGMAAAVPEGVRDFARGIDESGFGRWVEGLTGQKLIGIPELPKPSVMEEVSPAITKEELQQSQPPQIPLSQSLQSLREFGTAAMDVGGMLSGAAKEAIALASVKFDESFAERVAEMDRQAKELFESTRTDEERFEAERERLSKLFRGGRIDADLFHRGLMAAAPEQPQRQEVQVNRAVERDSAEAFEAMVRAMTPRGDDVEERRHEEMKDLVREEIRLLREAGVTVERWN